MGYDQDALNNLDAGYEPSCHGKVGAQSIFAIDWPGETPCLGYAAWTEEKPGFSKPVLTKA